VLGKVQVNMSSYTLQHERTAQHDFEFIEAGQGPTLLLLHGLFGALSNWQGVLDEFKDSHHVLIPLLPIYLSNEKVEPSVEGIAGFVHAFVQHKQLANDDVKFTLLGNSLGGHVALIYSLLHPQHVQSLILTGSSGLFETGMGTGFPRRGDYKYIKDRVAFTFYDPATATQALVDEVRDLINNRSAAIRIVKLARAAQRMNMAAQLRHLHTRTCLIWGLNDNITPPYVAHEFKRLIPNSELHFIDKCGHAAMMERPAEFNQIVRGFLEVTPTFSPIPTAPATQTTHSLRS